MNNPTYAIASTLLVIAMLGACSMNQAGYVIQRHSDATALRDTLLTEQVRLEQLDSLVQHRELTDGETMERNRLFFGHPDRAAALEAAEQELTENASQVTVAQREAAMRKRIPSDRASRLALNEATIREQARYMQLVAIPEAEMNQEIATERERLEIDQAERLTRMRILDEELYGGDSSRWALVGVGVAAYAGMLVGIGLAVAKSLEGTGF